MKDLYSETYKTLMKEIEGDSKEWQDIQSSCTARINIIKMAILLNATYRFNEIFIKYP